MRHRAVLTIEDLLQRVKITPNGCWEWQGCRESRGYGVLKNRGKTIRLHRLAYHLFIGSIPDTICILHHCDNPPCVNPQHLFLGTKTDNARDRDEKNRQAFGERNGRACFSEKDIVATRELYALNVPLKEIRDLFHISSSTLLIDILSGKLWPRLPIFKPYVGVGKGNGRPRISTIPALNIRQFCKVQSPEGFHSA